MRDWGAVAVRLYAVLVMLFLAAPLAMVIVLSFSANDYIAFPPDGFSLRWYRETLGDPRTIDAIVVSLKVAFAATVVGILVGLPTAVVLVRHRLPGRRPLLALSLGPLILPEVMIALALLFFIATTMRMPSNLFWLIVGHSVIVLPFAVQFLSSALAKLNPELEAAARTLGASPLRTFWRVTLPGMRSGLVSAALLSFIFSFDNVTISLFLNAPGISTLPVRLYEHATYSADLSLAAISAVLIYAGMAFLLLLGLFRGFDSAVQTSR